MNKTLPIILAGGSGTRLWPFSVENHPKQFIDLTKSGLSIFQMTILRTLETFGKDKKFLVVGNLKHRDLIKKQISDIGLDETNYIAIYEKKPYNTLLSCIIGALQAESMSFEHIVVMPSDQSILNLESFKEAIAKGINLSEQMNKISIFGIKPTAPNINYGYIKKGAKIDSHVDTYNVAQFEEKPNYDTALEYASDGKFFWNSGIFVAPVDVFIEIIKSQTSEVYNNIKKLFCKTTTKSKCECIVRTCFDSIPNISIDHAVWEKVPEKMSVIECKDLQWSDIGNFNAIYNACDKDDSDNLSIGNTILLDNVKDSYVINNSSNSKVSAILSNVGNIFVFINDNMIIITDKNKANEIPKFRIPLEQMA